MTPQSSEIVATAKDIVETTSVTCTAAEKATLTASITSLDALITEAEDVYKTLQAQLEEITGTTAAIVTTPLITVTTTTKAVSGRKRGFMKQLKFKM